MKRVTFDKSVEKVDDGLWFDGPIDVYLGHISDALKARQSWGFGPDITDDDRNLTEMTNAEEGF